MAPSVETLSASTLSENGTQHPQKSLAQAMRKEPLKVSGALSGTYFDVTPVIGREFPDTQLSELMSSPQRDALLRDLAIMGKCAPTLRIVRDILPK